MRALWVLMLAATAWGQTPTASVVGRIEDPSRGSLPGVKIQIRNKNTGEPREAVTEADGEFAVTNLVPGLYELFAERQGFKRIHETEFELQVDQTARFEFQMTVGDVSQSVEVTAEVPLLNTENASRGEVVVTQEIMEMPLEGRDFNDLTFMVPGVARKAQGGSGSALNINGARSDNTNFLIDGFANNNVRGGGAQARPPIDALQEYKLQTNGYPAEYGRRAGGVMSMVLKSGTNQFHGTLFEFLRDDVFDARNFFDAEKSQLRRNQFGGTLHGPLMLPRLYHGRNRTFFLGSWESYRQTQGVNRLGRVPTELERAGDFSKTLETAGTGKIVSLKDPIGNTAFPGNVMPASRVHAVSRNVLPFYPAPNLPAQVNNFRANRADTDHWDSFLGKIDHRLTGKDNLSGRYMRRINNQGNPFGGSDTGLFGNRTPETLSLGGVTWTRLWSPALIHELRFGFARQVQKARSVQYGTDWNAQLGLPSPGNPEAYGFPRITVRDLVAIGNAADQPMKFTTSDLELGGALTLVRDRHIWKFGGDAIQMQFYQPSRNNMRGTFNFLGRWSNDPFADFLLGYLNNATRKASGADPQLISWMGGLFAQDDWRASRSLTLNLGLRYEVNLPMYDRRDRLANFVPEYGKIVIADRKSLPDMDQVIQQAGLAEKVGYASDYGLPRSLAAANRKMLAPRFGFAWRPWATNRMVARGGYGIFYAASLTNPVRGDLADVFPFSVNQTFNRQTSDPNAVSFSTPFPASRVVLDGVNNSAGFQVWRSPPYLQCWNVTLEREIGAASAIEIAYVGSKGTHLGRRYNVNQPFRDPALRPTGSGSFPRPYSGISDIDYYAFGSNSTYNAGVLTWRRRFARGFFFRMNYVYAKSIDDASQLQGSSDGGYGGAQDARNLSLERGRSDFDTGHTMTMSFSWQTPFRRSRWLRGWQLTGSGRAYTGQPFTAKTSNVQLDQGEANRPDRIAKGMLDRRTPERWFDLSAFPVVPNGAFRFGNSGRNILDGPGWAGINLGVYRRFNTGERSYLQLRWEVFNLLNHPNLQTPNVNVNAITGGTITQADPPRTMQLALKWVF
ncbi:MAG: carboxypeptidase regulatory-like domain-containing protein [Bryobacterales bacterium]|nr:carboxypeptidase regulatory-like domain-containing protein [Bryobacterales bacterium]